MLESCNGFIVSSTGADWDFLRVEFPRYFGEQGSDDAIVIRGILNQVIN